MSLAEALRLTKISGDGLVRLRLRPEGVYRGSGRTWGLSTADLSFATHNGRVEAGQFLDITSESRRSDGAVEKITETLIYIKQDERLPSKGEWGMHFFITPDSIGEEEPEIVARGKEVVHWKSSDKVVSPDEAERAKIKAIDLCGRRLSDHLAAEPLLQDFFCNWCGNVGTFP